MLYNCSAVEFCIYYNTSWCQTKLVQFTSWQSWLTMTNVSVQQQTCSFSWTKTILFTVDGASWLLLLIIVRPVAEKTLWDRALVAGIGRIALASMARRGYVSFWEFHHPSISSGEMFRHWYIDRSWQLNWQ